MLLKLSLPSPTPGRFAGARVLAVLSMVCALATAVVAGNQLAALPPLDPTPVRAFPVLVLEDQQPAAPQAESDRESDAQAEEFAREQKEYQEFLRGLGLPENRVRLLPKDLQQLKADPNLLSRLWWQASPLEMASGSSGSYLGIGVADVTQQMATKLGLEEARGVVVTAVADGSPAQKAGLRVKDVVVAYNGARLEGRQQLTRMVGETPAERTITLSILRGGAAQELKLTTAARRMNPELKLLREGAMAGKNLFILPDLPRMVSIYRSPMLGMETEALSQQMAAFFGVSEGVLVREVIPESPAAKAGMKAGDVIVSIAGEKVSTPAEITSVLRAKSSSPDGLALGIVRNQKKLTLTITPSGDWTEGRFFPDDRDSQWSRK